MRILVGLVVLMSLAGCAQQAQVGTRYMPMGALCHPIALNASIAPTENNMARAQADLLKNQGRMGDKKAAKNAKRLERVIGTRNEHDNLIRIKSGGPSC